MMRLPKFAYHAPQNAAAVVELLDAEGTAAHVVAGGTDLYPNMKRRQREPKTIVSLRRVSDVRGVRFDGDGTLRLGPAESLRAVERHERVRKELPALVEAVESISTPVLRNMGTIGGNVCLDTRCYYVNQNFEWREAIDHCLKCGGDTCWTAPGSAKCWAVNSSDSVPVLIAMGARFEILGKNGMREVTAADFFNVTDGRDWLNLQPGELLTSIVIPPQTDAKSTYRKLRRRDAFDFPVLGVAARLEKDGPRIKAATIILNAIGPAPVRCHEAEKLLIGNEPTDETIAAAAALAAKAPGAKPLDNTDYMPSWRKKMVTVYVKRALTAVR